MMKAKGNGGEGLYVRRRSGQMNMEQGTYSARSKSQGRSNRFGCYICQSEKHLKRNCPRYNYKKSQGCVRIEDYVFDSRADGKCHVRGTGKVQVHMRDGSSVMLDNVRSTQQCTKSGVAKHLGVAGLQQQNRLVEERNVILLAKVRCFLIQCSLSKVLLAKETTMSTYLVNKVTSLAIGFMTPIDMLGFSGWLASKNQRMLEPVKVKCIFLGYRKGTGSVQVFQGVEFKVEPQEDHTFEVEPHGNVDHIVVAAVKKIYAHESLTLNNIVACVVISKWKAGLKDDMDARSYVYVLSNGCRKCSDEAMAITGSIHQEIRAWTYLLFNYPVYSSVFCLQGLLVVGDRMGLNFHNSLNLSPSSLAQALFTEYRLT
nr:zinc finger, CCHC-type [Tanacetum cinerariifolium]